MKAKQMALLAAVLAVASLSAIIASPDACATGDDIADKGAVSEVGLIANCGWQYTPTFPSDVGVVSVSFETNELGDIAKIENGKVTLSALPADSAGKRYNVVLKGTSADPDQFAYQWIRFTVYSEISAPSDEDIDATEGKSAGSSAVANGEDIAVKWTLKSGTLPAGFALDAATGRISGAYTGSDMGIAEVEILGTSTAGPTQTASKSITITYGPKLEITVLTADPIVTYAGNAQAVEVELQASFDPVEWNVTERTGFSIVKQVSDNKGTLTITGDAEAVESGEITVSAKAADGTEVSKILTYTVESALTVSGPTELTAKMGRTASASFDIQGGSSNTVTLSDNAYGDALVWKDGRLSITYPEEHATEKVTLTVTSAAGQVQTVDVDVTVEFSNGFTEPPGASGIYAYAE